MNDAPIRAAEYVGLAAILIMLLGGLTAPLWADVLFRLLIR